MRAARIALALGRVAAGILALVLVLSVVVNIRYGLVARQHALIAASVDLGERAPRVANPV